MRAVRDNTESDQLILLSEQDSLLQCVLKGRLISNDVVCRKYAHHDIAMGRLNNLSRCSQRWRRSPCHGFEHDALRRGSDLIKLSRCHEPMFFVTQHQRRFGITRALQAKHGLLNQRVCSHQRMKLLGVQGTREWPEAGAGATGKNDWDHGSGLMRCSRQMIRSQCLKIMSAPSAPTSPHG